MHNRIKTVLALALALPAVAGCSKTPRDRLQGRWNGEAIENVPGDQLAKATGWVKGTAIEFNGSKVTVTVPAETPRSGTFKVTKSDGDQVTVAFLRPEGGRDEAEFRFATDQTLRWEIGAGRAIVLSKALKN
ncbi:uncharacterized protein SOCE26_097860 [Sorangium cellulosum]|uniref:Secreted protein n=1 Tax=Sorangium cellulosum TaxID=56 RepID=A0A2L0F9K3_SORCE|nr:hypothetical protein [Sorangium cellulosum]AUX48254.1 uncharacterized protein SOCE26_097860 [Sorangium cellulosum]